MTNRDDQYWADMADEMQRALHMRPLTPAQAAQEYQEVPELAMDEDEIEESLTIAMSGMPKPSEEDEWADPTAGFSEIDQEVGEMAGMCRNEGEMSPDVQEEMRRKKEEALRKEETGDENEGGS